MGLKTQNFNACLESVEVLKKWTKKFISQNLKEICTFSHIRQTCFSYNFFVHF